MTALANTINLATYIQYRAYMKEVADTNLAINHYVFGDEDVMINDITAQPADKVLWAEPYEPWNLTNNDDNFTAEKRATFGVYGKPSDRKFETIQTYHNECELILQQIISKMIRDRHQRRIITPVTGWRVGPAEMIFKSTMLFGARCDFAFIAPLNLEYNPDHWTP